MVVSPPLCRLRGRLPREASPARPIGPVQRAGAARGQRIGSVAAELWADAHANNRRGKEQHTHFWVANLYLLYYCVYIGSAGQICRQQWLVVVANGDGELENLFHPNNPKELLRSFIIQII